MRGRAWAKDLAKRVGLPDEILPPLREPGDVIGTLQLEVADDVGLPTDLPVIAVGSHDTASAVVGVPAENDRFAYVSCGTWSLVGVELDAPVLTEDARRANFTNEGGVDGSIRFLRNVMGLWLLQESLRTWTAAGTSYDLSTLLAEAAAVHPFRALVDPDLPPFLPPGDMPARIADACQSTGQTPPQSPAATVRCILDSLAVAYRRTVRHAKQLTGRDIDVVHVVGGGARNTLLCQLTADACGIRCCRPGGGTALGSVLVQARNAWCALSDLATMRHCFVPRGFEAVRAAGGRSSVAGCRGADLRIREGCPQVTCINDAFVPQTDVRWSGCCAAGIDVDFPMGQTCCGQPMVTTATWTRRFQRCANTSRRLRTTTPS